MISLYIFEVILKRPELRLVISSATIEANKLKEFFDSRTSLKSEEQAFKEPFILRIPGRVFPVQVLSLENSGTFKLKIQYDF